MLLCTVLVLLGTGLDGSRFAPVGLAPFSQQVPVHSPPTQLALARLLRSEGEKLRAPEITMEIMGEGDSIPAPREGISWKDLGFGLTTKDTMMAVATCKNGDDWGNYEIKKYGPLPLEPASTILNYGQGLFEGMKAYRTSSGRIVLFRPGANAARQAHGARRLLMNPVPSELFLKICQDVVRANADWVPPAGVGALYLRPVLFGSGAELGVGASSEFTLVVFVAPVSQYFKGGARMRVEFGTHRAAPLGVGNVKVAGNYAPCFAPQKDAKAAGFSDIIYLDVSGKYIEEAAASNFFIVNEAGVLRTPALGSILPGVTRDSVLQVAKRLAESGSSVIRGVEEGKITLEEALSASEAFVTGTGAGLTPLAHIESDGKKVDFPCPGPVTEKLQEVMGRIQRGEDADTADWLWDLYDDGSKASKLADIEESFLA